MSAMFLALQMFISLMSVFVFKVIRDDRSCLTHMQNVALAIEIT